MPPLMHGCLGEMTTCCHGCLSTVHGVLTEPEVGQQTAGLLVRRHLNEGQGLNASARDEAALPEALHERRALLLPQDTPIVVHATYMS